MNAANPVLPIPSQQPVPDPDTDDALVRECLAEAALRRHLQRIHDLGEDRVERNRVARVGAPLVAGVGEQLLTP